MQTLKKLLATLFVTVMITTCFGATAFASELNQVGTQPEQTATTEDTANTINNENTVNTVNTEDTVNTVNDENTSSTTADTLGQTDSNVTSEDGLTQKEVFIDEQGQVYYIDVEKEVPEVIITEDAAEDKEVENKEAENKEAEDKAKEKTEPVEKKPAYSEKDLRLLACLIYAEAGNQSYNGMLGVANVVINRAKSDIYWHVDTIEEVIYDRKWSVQFAVTIKSKNTGLSMLDNALKKYDTGKFTGSNPEAEKKAMQQAIKAVKAALQGDNNIGNYLCFQNKRSANSIKRKYPDYKIIGDHIFYRLK